MTDLASHRARKRGRSSPSGAHREGDPESRKGHPPLASDPVSSVSPDVEKLEHWLASSGVLRKLAQCMVENLPSELGENLEGLSAISREQIVAAVGDIHGFVDFTHAAAQRLSSRADVDAEESANSKFASAADDSNMTLAAFGNLQDYHNGMDQRVGLPSANVWQAMELEHTGSADSNCQFTASNYGETVTTPSTEWEIVVEPTTDRTYPGKGRRVAPLGTFLMMFGTFNPDHIPIEIAKSALMKFPVQDAGFEQQLCRLCSAGATIEELAAGLQTWVPSSEVVGALESFCKTLEDQCWMLAAPSALDNFAHLDEAAYRSRLRSCISDPSSTFSTLQTSLEELIDAASLAALVQKQLAVWRSARLAKEEIVALRLYTGPMYVKFNAVCRNFPHGIVEGLQGNKYATTLHALVSGLIKLQTVSKVPETRLVYRGVPPPRTHT